jgi:hypothetical protein
VPTFVRVTELDGGIHWINLDHVRQLVVKKPVKGMGKARTAVMIDNQWAERRIDVLETPEEILAQTRG